MPNVNTTLTNDSVLKHVSNSLAKHGYAAGAIFVSGYAQALKDTNQATMTLAEFWHTCSDPDTLLAVVNVFVQASEVIPEGTVALIDALEGAITGTPVETKNAVAWVRVQYPDIEAHFRDDKAVSVTLTLKQARVLAKGKAFNADFVEAQAALLAQVAK